MNNVKQNLLVHCTNESGETVTVKRTAKAPDVAAGAKIFENLVAQGITDIHAKRQPDGSYVIEYEVEIKQDDN